MGNRIRGNVLESHFGVVHFLARMTLKVNSSHSRPILIIDFFILVVSIIFHENQAEIEYVKIEIPEILFRGFNFSLSYNLLHSFNWRINDEGKRKREGGNVLRRKNQDV